MKNEFSLAFNEVLEEKGLPREVILAAIESAMVSAYRRAVNASNAQHVEAKIDPETGRVLIYAEKEVVEDVQDTRTEVLLEEARKVKPDAQLGDMVVVETTPADFGRVAAQTARQVIQQRIREAERSAQMQYFERQQGEIVSGVVQAINASGITIGLDMRAEGLMPPNQKVPGERFHLHERVRAIVLEVKDGTRGPQIILSRAHKNFLRRLLENEVPEIYHGVVEIRAIAREPGQRSKVAVYTSQSGVDPVGACVGIKGVRIQAIVKELHDEKIDIIEWNEDPVIYISKALSPARVSGVYLSEGGEGGRTATVVVSEDQLSLAIGRDGQNARLAAKLTGWRIDIKSLPEAAAEALQKLRDDADLAAMLPAAVESVPAVEAVLAKKAEGRPVTPEEFSLLLQFIDRVERRSLQRQEEALRQEQQRVEEARASVPAAAFEMPLAQLGLPDHVRETLEGAKFQTVGDLMLALRLEPDRVLGLEGIGPRTMQLIEAALKVLVFPEPAPQPAVEEAPVAAAVAEEPQTPSAPAEVEEAEPASLDELFTLRPDMLKAQPESDERPVGAEERKKKKKQKKGVTLEYDEKLGEVVGRKQHKRGGDDWEEEW